MFVGLTGGDSADHCVRRGNQEEPSIDRGQGGVTVQSWADDLRELAAIAQIGYARLDAHGCFEDMNDPYLAMLARTRQDLTGESWRLTVHPDDHHRTEQAYESARLGGHGYVEIRGLRADGSIVYQSITVARRTRVDGEFAGYLCLRHDISGYKADQEALLLAVESSPNGLLMLNSAGHIRLANTAVEELFGYSRQELLGQPVELLLPERFRARHREHRHSFNSNDAMNAMAGRDLRGLRKDGREIPLQVSLNTIETPAGRLTVCNIIDIAERLRYQAQLELAKQAAESANRAKSDFLARMSHEIRTPMNLIMGMNALLLESELTSRQREYVEISYRNVRRLLRLINGILDLSKVEANKLTLEAVPFNLKEVLAECAATIGAAIEQKGLRFDLQVDPAVWPYWLGDPERLQQVLLNLIGNAVKFTARGGIDVSVRPTLDSSGAEGVMFEVSDTGCGIPPEKAGMIFEAFQQAEGEMNRTYEGTGLGLAIAKTIVELMAGRIWVAPKEGPGSKIAFTVFFPRISEEKIARRTAEHVKAKAQQQLRPGTRVLVAEDNPENVVLLQAYLHGLPLSLDFASNGVEAFEKRRQNEFDLILMDIQMPVMDGYVATREIRTWERQHQRARVPIVALTAHALSGAAQESKDAGCDGHVSKPVEKQDLVDAIARFAAASRPASAPPPAAPSGIEALRPRFLANRKGELVKLREALAARDFNTIRIIGHNCKGIGKGYGYPEISELGAAIETAARACDTDATAESLASFERCVLEACGEAVPSAAA